MALVEGFDGSQLHVRERPIPGTSRKQEQTLRSQPGTFIWRYGRGKNDRVEALFLAGSEFALVFERAGLDGPHGVDWSSSGASQWRGLPAPRLAALDKWKNVTQELGKLVTARLIQYVCERRTAGEIAKMYGVGNARKAAIVLEEDLKAAAVYFGYPV